MDMPSRYFQAIYYEAWKESQQRAAEVEAEEAKAKAEAVANSKTQANTSKQRLSQQIERM